MNIADEMDMPRPRRTHRGRRSRGKGPKPPVAGHGDAHAQAQQHIAAAQKATDPKAAHAHLFKAISALKKCQ